MPRIFCLLVTCTCCSFFWPPCTPERLYSISPASYCLPSGPFFNLFFLFGFDSVYFLLPNLIFCRTDAHPQRTLPFWAFDPPGPRPRNLDTDLCSCYSFWFCFLLPTILFFCHGRCAPAEAVIFPESTEQVSQCVQICSQNNIPMIPFGTGTGLEGGVGAMNVSTCMQICRRGTLLWHLSILANSHWTAQ